jgi:hypothetical protein
MDARFTTDRENRTVTIVEISIPQVKFPESSSEGQRMVAEFLEAEIPKLELTFSLDRFLTTLEASENQVAGDNALKNDPPNILVRTTPTILVVIDGEPELRPIPNSAIMRVINTPYVLLLEPSAKQYYLTDGQSWYSSALIKGPWVIERNIPQEVRTLAPPDSSESESMPSGDTPPAVLVATTPTELIVTDGPPAYVPIAGTNLLAIENTESTLFMDLASQNHFILLSGRWYKAASLDGAWSYVASDALPGDFAKIPPESSYGEILAFVAGTDQAKDAVLDASIPQTSAISRTDTSLVVVYDGEPKFVDIEGTTLKYASNTEFAVLQSEGRFYCCNEAVWYEAPTPRGPWSVSVTIPSAIYEQPPSSPTYNTKYVYVYETTPTVVYVGYLPGYAGCYVYGPTIVYGTGYYYPPYVGPVYYYPRPVTFGFHAHYNPYTGWGFGVTYSTGFVTFGMSWHNRYYPRPPYGAPYRGAPYHRYYGPGGYRPAYPPPRTGGPRPAPVNAGVSNRANIYSRPTNTARNVPSTRVSPGQQPNVTRGGTNNVMTDRGGNVYRQNQSGSWQKRESTGWSTPSSSPTNRTQQQPQTSQTRPQQLERERAAQQRGVQRSQDFNRQRQASPSQRGTSRPSTGRRR